MNSYTKTPVNGVWIAAFCALLLGLLAFAGAAAITAIFALAIAGQNVAYSIPISCRFVFRNNFQPGPFNLGKFVCLTQCIEKRRLIRLSAEFACRDYSCDMDGVHHHCLLLPRNPCHYAYDDELYSACSRRCPHPGHRLLLLPGQP